MVLGLNYNLGDWTVGILDEKWTRLARDLAEVGVHGSSFFGRVGYGSGLDTVQISRFGSLFNWLTLAK